MGITHRYRYLVAEESKKKLSDTRHVKYFLKTWIEELGTRVHVGNNVTNTSNNNKGDNVFCFTPFCRLVSCCCGCGIWTRTTKLLHLTN